MMERRIIPLLAIMAACAAPKGNGQIMERRIISLDANWRFHLGEVAAPPKTQHYDFYVFDGAKTGGFLRGPQGPDFDDNGWRELSVPHDWCVEQTFSPNCEVARGYVPMGTAWYRRRFEVPADVEGCRLLLVFDGLYRNSRIFLNGHDMGGEESGFIPVTVDITDQARYGQTNLLAIHLDVSQNEGWWYEGGGINRHVRLYVLPPTHFALDGACIRSQVATEAGRALGPAVVTASYTVCNDGDNPFAGQLSLRLKTADGVEVAHVHVPLTLEPWEQKDVPLPSFEVAEPMLWSPDTPTLYTAEALLEAADGSQRDGMATAIGFREIVFSAEKGFLINGVSSAIKGTCNHVDHPGVGIAIPDGLHDYRILCMKAAGSNAWRCAHNPPAPEFLDACDRLGMMVMDETRRMDTTPYGIRQLETMLKRDRNHPSIIIWSIGNEEVYHQGSDVGVRICKTLKRIVRKWDPTRPVTLAMNGAVGGPVSPLLDVQGVNYFPDWYDGFHEKYPNLPIIATESSPSFCTRGVYDEKPPYGHFNSYDVKKVGFGHCLTAEIAWTEVDARPWVLGEFTWPGLDYHGEPEPCRWPCVATNMGITDSCGFPKDHFYYYKSWWTQEPVLHIFPHWNWQGREGQPIAVWCYSNCERIELFINGKSLGCKEMQKNGHLEWQVPYEAGQLEAKGWRKGNSAAEEPDAVCVRETTGVPVALKILDATPQGVQDVAIMNITAVDAKGRTVPTADHRVLFELEGAGRIAGTGNGDPLSHESETAPERRLFNGWCQVIVLPDRTTASPCKLTARAEPLAPDSMELP